MTGKNNKSNHNGDISPTLKYDKTNKSQYDNINELEFQINNLVYQLYDLMLDSMIWHNKIIKLLKKPNSPPKTP